ncbi:tetratricopeptide repeat protein [Halomonas mongoliensis]|uniref:Tetratricopeptide repeat protein n=1 Tax=Halomonas mongoliensis TaxID=321265 RepID=A0ABU1GQW0_9GAMM|nr:tetratricopeptide repeat protein [Halomonas mongoliensis]MDR5894423.1 tetratricopeptide repeat protein [Halomonas mongoliensis]
MIKVVLVAALLALSPLAQAGLIFDESEKLEEIFQSQDFDVNLVKAEGGDVRAQYLVGAAYLYGLEEQEVEVDHEKGLYWLKVAARQGAAEAFDDLAIAYRNGIGVKKDASKYEAYLAESAERGMSAARLEIMNLYRYGDPEIGVEKDEEKYLYWLEYNAEAGYSFSMITLSLRYREGRGFEVDFYKAFEWIIRAVEQDDSIAQAYAGEFFEEGLGTEQDFVKAYMMYDLSTGIGRKAKYELADKMTEEQIEEAIARSWQWQLKHGVVRPSSDGYRYQPDVSDLEPLSFTPESDQ